jgi:hypothetical protein
LIENKVGASEQHEQAERYHIRGARSQQEGKLDRFVTCMCAPQSYLDNLSSDSAYQHRVSYEAIAKWFEQLDGPRHAWRHRIMQEAIGQGRRGYTMVVNTTTTAFFAAYWEYLRRNHPQIQMRKPTPKGNKSNWLIMKGINFPKRVQIHHKVERQVVELGFDGRTVTELLAIKNEWPADVFAVQRGRTAALSIVVPLIDMEKGIAAQEKELQEVFAAVYRLLPYARLFDNAG